MLLETSSLDRRGNSSDKVAGRVPKKDDDVREDGHATKMYNGWVGSVRSKKVTITTKQVRQVDRRCTKVNQSVSKRTIITIRVGVRSRAHYPAQ